MTFNHFPDFPHNSEIFKTIRADVHQKADDYLSTALILSTSQITLHFFAPYLDLAYLPLGILKTLFNADGMRINA